MFVVFQCRRCNAILGDSSHWLKSVKEVDLIALGDVTDGAIYASQYTCRVTSEFRIDRGAEYRVLRCAECDNQVGLYYLDTGRFDKNLKHAYLLHIKGLKPYEVPVVEVPAASL